MQKPVMAIFSLPQRRKGKMRRIIMPIIDIEKREKKKERAIAGSGA